MLAGKKFLIQEKLDNGTLYMYLRRLDKRMRDLVHSQADRWAKNDKELIEAHNQGDIRKEAGLYNCLINMAEESLYPCVIYV